MWRVSSNIFWYCGTKCWYSLFWFKYEFCFAKCKYLIEILFSSRRSCNHLKEFNLFPDAAKSMLHLSVVLCDFLSLQSRKRKMLGWLHKCLNTSGNLYGRSLTFFSFPESMIYFIFLFLSDLWSSSACSSKSYLNQC